MKPQNKLSSEGSLTLAVDSTEVDSVISVVYTAPKSGGAQPALGLDADGMSQTGFAIGAGTCTARVGADAPKVAAGTGHTATVVSVDTKVKTIQGDVGGGVVATSPTATPARPTRHGRLAARRRLPTTG